MSLRRLRERIPYRSRCTQRAQLSHVLKEFVEYGGERTKEWPKLEGKNALSVIWEVLSHCPDEVPNSKDFHLRFMPDEEPLKSMLLVDLGSIESALHNGEWKAATVISGSVVEALLLWALDRHPHTLIDKARAAAIGNGMNKPRYPQRENRDLVHYIEVSLEAGDITPDTAASARLAKNFRNLMHPAHTRRKRVTCDRGTATVWDALPSSLIIGKRPNIW